MAATESASSRLQALFAQAVELEPERRGDFLAAACAGDAVLRERLVALLAADAALEQHTVRPLAAAGVLDALHGATALAGLRIGAWELREEIGSGGMGRVYRAERVDGTVAQQAAVKIIRRELLDELTLRRFEAERRLLATLDHPNIARLMDAGELADGTPYYVMELVAGEPITTHCDRARLGVAARLALVRQVCDAVLHAHRALVVHRDLKPGNILVTASGLPKLLDFGIAKPLDAASLEQTGTAHRVFSPLYAAPEQLLGEPIGVACDVYALGLLLYELLAGSRPFDFAGLSAGQVETLVVRTPVEAPGVRALRATHEQVAARGLAHAKELSRELRGDLDGIVLRCLRKAPAERYGSVERLDADIANALEGRPVEARGGHAWYRVRKFVGRHRVAVAFAALAVAAIATTAVVTTVQAVRMQRERDAALAAKREAEFEQRRAETVADFLVGLFRSGNPSASMQRDVGARELLVTGARRVESELANEPALRARLLETIARSLIGMSALDQAESVLADARTARESLDDESARDAPENALLRASIAKARGNYDGALEDAERAVAALSGSGSPSLRAEAHELRGALRYNLGEPDGMLADYERAHAVLLDAYGADDPRTLRAARRVGAGLNSLREYDRAAAVLESSLERIERVLPRSHSERADTQVTLAIVEQARGRPERAKALVAAALEVQREVFGERSLQVALTLNTHAAILQRLGEHEAAGQGYERAAELQRELAGRDAPIVATIEFNRGQLYHLTFADAARARAPLEDAVRIARMVWPLEDPRRSRFEVGLASVLVDLGEGDEEALRALVEITRERDPALSARARGELASVQLKRGDTRAAAATVAGAVEVLTEIYGPEDEETLRVRRIRDSVAAATGR